MSSRSSMSRYNSSKDGGTTNGTARMRRSSMSASSKAPESDESDADMDKTNGSHSPRRSDNSGVSTSYRNKNSENQSEKTVKLSFISNETPSRFRNKKKKEKLAQQDQEEADNEDFKKTGRTGGYANPFDDDDDDDDDDRNGDEEMKPKPKAIKKKTNDKQSKAKPKTIEKQRQKSKSKLVDEGIESSNPFEDDDIPEPSNPFLDEAAPESSNPFLEETSPESSNPFLDNDSDSEFHSDNDDDDDKNSKLPSPKGAPKTQVQTQAPPQTQTLPRRNSGSSIRSSGNDHSNKSNSSSIASKSSISNNNTDSSKNNKTDSSKATKSSGKNIGTIKEITPKASPKGARSSVATTNSLAPKNITSNTSKSTKIESKSTSKTAVMSTNEKPAFNLDMFLDDSWQHGTVLKTVLSNVIDATTSGMNDTSGSGNNNKNPAAHSSIPIHDNDHTTGGLEMTISNMSSIRSSTNRGRSIFEQARSVVTEMTNAREHLLKMKKQVRKMISESTEDMQSKEKLHEKDVHKVESSLPDCFQTFNALDKRVGLVARTAAEVGDRLQTADTVHKNATDTIALIEALQQLTRGGDDDNNNDTSNGDVTGDDQNGSTVVSLPDIIKDESRPTEAAAMIEKLKHICEVPASSSNSFSLLNNFMGSSGNGNTANDRSNNNNNSHKSSLMKKALENLRYCSNELENRLLLRFDEALIKKDIASMKTCATSLVQFSGGTSLMKRFVMSRPIFKSIDHNLEKAENDEGLLSRALGSLFRDFKSKIAEDANLVRAIFIDQKTVNQVMEMLVERVIEQRVASIIEFIATPPPEDERNMETISVYLRVIDDTYRRTEELGKNISEIGCGGFDVEGSIEALFGQVRDNYIPYENNLLVDLMDFEFQNKAENDMTFGGSLSDSDDDDDYNESNTNNDKKMNGDANKDSKDKQLSLQQVENILKSTKDAIVRCENLFNSLQVGHVIASLYETLVIGVSRAISHSVNINLALDFDQAKEEDNAHHKSANNNVDNDNDSGNSPDNGNGNAHGNDENSAEVINCQKVVDLFRVALSRIEVATLCHNAVYRFYLQHVKPKVYNLTSAMMRCHTILSSNSEESETKIVSVFEELMLLLVHQSETLLSKLQQKDDFLPDMNDMNSAFLNNSSTDACRTLLSQLLEPCYKIVHGSLDAENRETFLVEVATRLHHILLRHITKYTFSATGGLQLKRDIAEYQDFVKKFTIVNKSGGIINNNSSHGSSSMSDMGIVDLSKKDSDNNNTSLPVVGGVVSSANISLIVTKFSMLANLVNVFIVAPDSLSSLIEGQLKMNRKDVLRYVSLRSDYKADVRRKILKGQ